MSDNRCNVKIIFARTDYDTYPVLSHLVSFEEVSSSTNEVWMEERRLTIDSFIRQSEAKFDQMLILPMLYQECDKPGLYIWNGYHLLVNVYEKGTLRFMGVKHKWEKIKLLTVSHNMVA
jgi:hypothetical protein